MEGVLLPNTEFTAAVDFLCKKPVSFSQVPIFRCTLSYPEYSMVIDSFIVVASAKTHLPKYEIYPSNEMHFGYQLIGTEKSQEVVIKNTGMFDFNFIIRSLREIMAEKNKGEKKKGKKGDESKSGSKKGSKKSSEKSSKKSDAKSSKKSSKKSKASSKDSKGSKKKKGGTPKLVKNCVTSILMGYLIFF